MGDEFEAGPSIREPNPHDTAERVRIAEIMFKPVAREDKTAVAAAALHIAFTLYAIADASQEQAEAVCRAHIKSYLKAGN